MWIAHPWTGVGLGAFHVHFPSFAQADLVSKWPAGQSIVNYAHNEYLQVLAEGGILLLLSFLLIFFFFLRSGASGWLKAGVGAALIQNLASVDMRFGVSLASVLLVMGLALEPRKPDEPEDSRTHPVWIRVVLTLAGAGAFLMLLPMVLSPYRSAATVASTPAFFDQRLLDPAKTISDLEQLAAEYPEEATVWDKLGYAYAKEIQTPDQRLRPDMAEKATAAYRRAVKLDPARVSAYNNLANIAFTLGRVEEAQTLWKKAIEVKPEFVDARLNLGKIYYTRGDLKAAADQFEEVLKLDPNNAEARVYLKRMVE
jgi:Flp pilus assembly protein TadD